MPPLRAGLVDCEAWGDSRRGRGGCQANQVKRGAGLLTQDRRPWPRRYWGARRGWPSVAVATGTGKGRGEP